MIRPAAARRLDAERARTFADSNDASVDPRMRLKPAARRMLYATIALLVGTGAGWLAVHYATAFDDLRRLALESLLLKFHGAAAFAALGTSLTPVQTPVGDAWILAEDEPAVRAAPGPVAPARLLPSGDAYLLRHGADRDLVVPDAARRDELWPPRVWPGGLLVAGEIAGIWAKLGATSWVS